jgi:hypothetical protein
MDDFEGARRPGRPLLAWRKRSPPPCLVRLVPRDEIGVLDGTRNQSGAASGALVALVVAFAVLAIMSSSVSLLHEAEFVPKPSSAGLPVLMVGAWFVGMIASPRFNR